MFTLILGSQVLILCAEVSSSDNVNVMLTSYSIQRMNLIRVYFCFFLTTLMTLDDVYKRAIIIIFLVTFVLLLVNPLSANPTKWSNILKQFVDNLTVNCLSVFDHFVGLAIKGLKPTYLFDFITHGAFT